MKHKVVLLAAVAAISGLCCNYGELPQSSIDTDREHQRDSPEKGRVHLSESALDFADIEVEDVQYRETRSVLRAMGKMLAPRPQTAIVSHPYAGRVAEIHVRVGDWVEKGAALITLDSNEVGQAKSEFYKAIADLELARLNLTREQRLLSQGIGIKKNHVAADAAHKIAQASAEAAEKKLHLLGFTEEQVQEIVQKHQINPAITLFAPIKGKVVTSEAVLGVLVDETTEILTIIDTTKLWVDAEIYEKDIAKVKIGQKVQVVVPAYPGELFDGEIHYIGDVVNEETQTITVCAEVANDDFRLKPGMFADVEILLNRNQKMLVVPQSAALEDGDKKIVFVKEADHFVRREIETGDVDGDHLQITGGLEAGEKVVVQGSHQLRTELLGETLTRICALMLEQETTT